MGHLESIFIIRTMGLVADPLKALEQDGPCLPDLLFDTAHLCRGTTVRILTLTSKDVQSITSLRAVCVWPLPGTKLFTVAARL